MTLTKEEADQIEQRLLKIERRISEIDDLLEGAYIDFQKCQCGHRRKAHNRDERKNGVTFIRSWCSICECKEFISVGNV